MEELIIVDIQGCDKIKCPKCNTKSRVTRTIFKRDFTMRYRQCNNKKCGYKFKTMEQIAGDWHYKTIVKKIKDLVREVN